MTAAITAVLYAIHLRHSYPTRYLVHHKRTHRFSLLQRTQYLFLALNITHYSFSPHCIVLVIVILAVSVLPALLQCEGRKLMGVWPFLMAHIQIPNCTIHHYCKICVLYEINISFPRPTGTKTMRPLMTPWTTSYSLSQLEWYQLPS